MISARQITAELRKLLPQVQPLKTQALLSDNGLLLGYEVTMPKPAAQHIGGTTNLADMAWLGNYLTRHLGQDLYVEDVFGTRRRDYSILAHLIIKTGRRP
jgi:hypothetical protein